MTIPIQAIRAALKAATQGPFRRWKQRVCRADDKSDAGVFMAWSGEQDADLVMLLLNNAPALLTAAEENKRLRARVADLKEDRTYWQDQFGEMAAKADQYAHGVGLDEAWADNKRLRGERDEARLVALNLYDHAHDRVDWYDGDGEVCETFDRLRAGMAAHWRKEQGDD